MVVFIIPGLHDHTSKFWCAAGGYVHFDKYSDRAKWMKPTGVCVCDGGCDDGDGGCDDGGGGCDDGGGH